MSTTVKGETPLSRVCVWFGTRKIVEHVGESAYAACFEAAMRRRFACLRVTNEPIGISDADKG